MKLNPSPFSKIQSHAKTIELRLYDEKRRKIKPGDTILFRNSENAGETVLTKVLDLHIFETFDELYKCLPLLQCGYTEETVGSASANDMLQYYSLERQRQFGVVGIHVTVI